MLRFEFLRNAATFVATAKARLLQGATMALDFTALRNYVNKFRKGSPNIAGAFDEGEKLWSLVDDSRVAGDAELAGQIAALNTRVVALEGATPPPPPPPPPPTAFASPLGYISNDSPGFFPTTQLENYGVISSEGPAPDAFRGINLLYRTANTCQTGYTNISDAECRANGWYLTYQGQPLTDPQFGGTIANVGLPAYQARWAELTLAKLQAHQADGFFSDNASPVIYFQAGNKYPDQYPSNASYADAMFSFYKFQTEFFGPRGYKTAWNCLIPLDDTATQFVAWGNRVGTAKAAHILTAEYWMARGDYLRTDNPVYHWSAWRNAHKVCNQHGMGFFPLDEERGQSYTLGTFMLDWNANPLSAHCWRGAGASQDWWHVDYGKALQLGLPTGPATNVGYVWTRPFEHGSLTVRSDAATATFTVA